MDDSTHGHYQVINTEIRLIILFVAKEGKTLHSKQKQDLKFRSWTTSWKIQTETKDSRENHKGIHAWPKSNSIQLYSGSDK